MNWTRYSRSWKGKMRSDAEVLARLKRYERECKKRISEKPGSGLWLALQLVAEREWHDWFLRKKRK